MTEGESHDSGCNKVLCKSLNEQTACAGTTYSGAHESILVFCKRCGLASNLFTYIVHSNIQ